MTALGSGQTLRMIGVHAKSKAPHGARNKQEAVRISIANRRKQLAQCIWLRQRVDDHVRAGDPLIVLGDFNDGPGLDEYEKLFGRSGVEIVLGMDHDPAEQLYDPHAMAFYGPRRGPSPSTARFFKHQTKTYLNALLDYVMVSPDLMEKSPDWTIWHPFDHAECFQDEGLSRALLEASDHFPVTLDIEI